MISLIWAMDVFWLIGKDNILPWHHKEDLQYFKNHTKDKTVLMGDLTYQSLKYYYKKKPLPFGKIYVANLENKHYEDAQCITDVDTFLTQNTENVIVIGGRTIYQIALKYADLLYITYILEHHNGNVYFPSFDLSAFDLISKSMSNQLIFTVYKKK